MRSSGDTLRFDLCKCTQYCTSSDSDKGTSVDKPLEKNNVAPRANISRVPGGELRPTPRR